MSYRERNKSFFTKFGLFCLVASLTACFFIWKEHEKKNPAAEPYHNADQEKNIIQAGKNWKAAKAAKNLALYERGFCDAYFLVTEAQISSAIMAKQLTEAQAAEYRASLRDKPLNVISEGNIAFAIDCKD